jgi:hypothetical protein
MIPGRADRSLADSHGNVMENVASLGRPAFYSRGRPMRFIGSKAFEEFWSFLEKESPRCVSIVIAAYCEERLRSLLSRRKGDLADLIDRALKDNILTKDEHHDLHSIRKLRNKFAHELRERDFDDAKSKQVNELRIWKKADEDIPYRAECLSTARERILYVAAALYGRLKKGRKKSSKPLSEPASHDTDAWPIISDR